MKTLLFAGKASPDTQSHALGWLNSLSLREDCEARIWKENENISSFDIFDTFKPDVFWCHSQDLNRSLVKVLLDKEYEETKAIIFLSDIEDAKPDEIKYVTELSSKYPTMFSQNFEKHLPEWKGVRCLSCLPAADITRFKPKNPNPEYSKDISFIGQWHAGRAEVYKKYLFPYLNIGLKIYGFGNWPVANHLGSVSNIDTLCDIMSNSSQILSVSNERLRYPSERVFKTLACKGRPVILNVNNEYEEFFKEKCLMNHGKAQIVKNVDEVYNWVFNNHTYTHRINQVFEALEIE